MKGGGRGRFRWCPFVFVFGGWVRLDGSVVEGAGVGVALPPVVLTLEFRSGGRGAVIEGVMEC